MKKKNLYIIGAICVVLAVTVAVFAFLAERRASQEYIENAGAAVHAVITPTSIEYKGESYPLKKHIESILLIGTDKSTVEHAETDEGITPFFNYEQADFLALLVIDNDTQTCSIIQINRDSMTDVPWLSVTGDVGGTSYEQIALSHTYGSGKEDSCVNTRNAVSSLLFDAPIDKYIAFSMSAVPVLNDLVGGVTVTIVDDLTPVDPDFVQGKTITLRGEQSLSFVRARMTVGDGTNISRMRRHRDYLQGFMTSARSSFNSDSKFALKAIEALTPYMTTDMTAEAMSALVEKLDTYTIEPIQHSLGENKLGEKFYEFYTDYDDSWKIVRSTFCITK